MPVGNVAAIIAARRARRHSKGFRPTPATWRRRCRANSSVGLRNAVGRAPSQISTVATGGAVPRRDQIVKLLTDTDSSTPPGTPPSADQVDFLLKLYDKAGDQSIELGELEELLTCWHTYTEHRELFESKLEKFDISKTGKLSQEELKAYLTDLNGGIEVEDSEVEWVMKEGDVLGDGQLNKMELWRATALWTLGGTEMDLSPGAIGVLSCLAA
ncbi:Uncharacterized protein SCF082_LOCUS4256 [Durusdinium trenchii]|uniref:EF-hand domain-containing protein n=1 Tax=Durusdinium trenchii TaxID=1381693 RepID=A0ABP0I1P6_9DINO